MLSAGLLCLCRSHLPTSIYSLTGTLNSPSRCRARPTRSSSSSSSPRRAFLPSNRPRCPGRTSLRVVLPIGILTAADIGCSNWRSCTCQSHSTRSFAERCLRSCSASRCSSASTAVLAHCCQRRHRRAWLRPRRLCRNRVRPLWPVARAALVRLFRVALGADAGARPRRLRTRSAARRRQRTRRREPRRRQCARSRWTHIKGGRRPIPSDELPRRGDRARSRPQRIAALIHVLCDAGVRRDLRRRRFLRRAHRRRAAPHLSPRHPGMRSELIFFVGATGALVFVLLFCEFGLVRLTSSLSLCLWRAQGAHHDCARQPGTQRSAHADQRHRVYAMLRWKFCCIRWHVRACAAPRRYRSSSSSSNRSSSSSSSGEGARGGRRGKQPARRLCP